MLIFVRCLYQLRFLNDRNAFKLNMFKGFEQKINFVVFMMLTTEESLFVTKSSEKSFSLCPLVSGKFPELLTSKLLSTMTM